MNQSEIVNIVTSVLQETQALSGRQWRTLDPNSKPIGHLDGFDSLCGLEATLMLETRFGCSFGQDSVFVSADGGRALTMVEVAALIASRIATK